MDIEWRFKTFEGLTKTELHEMIILRQQVFVVEQDCPYQDADEKDKDSHHLMGYIKGVLVAYLRLVKPGISYEEMSFGRIVIAQSHRGTGLGVLHFMGHLKIVFLLNRIYYHFIKNLALNQPEKNT